MQPRPENSIVLTSTPGALPLPRPAPFARAIQRLKNMLGFRRRLVVAGVRYTERSSETLRRALSRKGSGRKDYDALFPDGTRLRLRATPWRTYADLTPPRLQPVYELAAPLLRPGMRVLDLACSTGWSADWLARQLGPSGAVVALDRDGESITYALARYRKGAIAFEQGFVESLTGELNGSFSGVIAVGAIFEADEAKKLLTEAWRVVTPGGFLMAAQPTKPAVSNPHRESDPQPAAPRAMTDSQLCDLLDSVTGIPATPLASPVPDFSAAFARKAVPT